MKTKKLIGNKNFYKMVMLIALPIMLQQGITSFVSLLDNIMVGRVGTEEMSGVAIANQLLFVYNLCIFGCLSGASIFLSQFFGAKDNDGIRYCFRFKFITAIMVFIITGIIFFFFGTNLINLFLNDTGELVGNIDHVLKFGNEYLRVMLYGLLPFAISQVYGTTLRETQEAIVPMVAGLIAIAVNLIFNYILIFGHFGFPAMGVKGAAIATVISRFFEMGILVIYTHLKSNKYIYIKGVYRTLKIPFSLVQRIMIKGTPLIMNEVLWSIGLTVIVQCYSVRGLVVIAAYNISSTVSGIFFVSFQALGRAIAIIVGQLLGAKEFEEAKETTTKMLFFTSALCLFLGLVLISISFFIPKLYNTTESVKKLATSFMIVAGVCLPIFAFNSGCYYTLRAGGVTTITFLFDSVFVWVVSIPLAFVLAKYTPINIVYVYFIVQFSEIIKSFIGYTLIKKEVWVQNFVLT